MVADRNRIVFALWAYLNAACAGALSLQSIPGDRRITQPSAEPNFVKLPPPEKFKMNSPATGSSSLVKVYDARALQSMFSGTEADFFEKHGFVLLPVPKSLSKSKVFHAENLGLLPLLFPSMKVVYPNMCPGMDLDGMDRMCTHRDQSNTYFEEWYNHQDIGLNASSFTHPSINDWFMSKIVGNPEVVQFTRINLWKPVNMTEPLDHTPLAVADYRYNSLEDVVGFASEPAPGSVPDGLRIKTVYKATINAAESQRWYYYPHMTNDEVLVFKAYEWRRGDDFSTPYMRTAFHGALPIFSGASRHSVDCRDNIALGLKE